MGKRSAMWLGLFLVLSGAAVRAQFRERVFQGEKLVPQAQASRGRVVSQSMRRFGKGWSRGAQLVWSAPAAGHRLKVRFPNRNAGSFRLVGLFTAGPKYGNVRASVNGKKVDEVITCGADQVRPSGAIELGTFKLRPGMNVLQLRLVGPKKGSACVGLDALAVFPIPRFEGLREEVDARYQAFLSRFPRPDASAEEDEEEGDGSEGRP